MKRINFIMAMAAAGIISVAGSAYLTSVAAQQIVSKVKKPKLSPIGLLGKGAYEESCARCHGKKGAGTRKGPPLIHEIYNPGHHPDEAFFRAAREGVPQHHWPYGNMPPRPELTNGQIGAIVKYIREVQKANGIVYKQHVM